MEPPDDIRQRAWELDQLTWRAETHAEAIAFFERYLLAERLSVRERAAKIAESNAHEECEVAEAIAAAIRSQI